MHIKRLPTKSAVLKKSLLSFFYVRSLRSAVSFDDFESYGLAFFQSFEAFALNSREVNEYIVLTFYFDESETFLKIVRTKIITFTLPVFKGNYNCLNAIFLKK